MKILLIPSYEKSPNLVAIDSKLKKLSTGKQNLSGKHLPPVLIGLIPHNLLKSRISNFVHNTFRKKDGSVRYTHIKVTRAKGYFTYDINGDGDNMYTVDPSLKSFLIYC